MSNPIDLGQQALSAQGQILARSATRIGRRIAYAVVALVCLMFAAISFHGLLWALFLEVAGLSYVWSALCVLGLDLLGVILFLLLARKSIPDPVEIEARIRRDRKLIELKQALAISALTGLVFGPVGRFTGRRAGSFLKNVFFRR